MSTLETRRDDFSHFIPGNAKGSNQALYKKCHVDATRRQNFGQMHTYVDLSNQAIRTTSAEVIGGELDKSSTVLPHPGQIQYNFGFLGPQV